MGLVTRVVMGLTTFYKASLGRLFNGVVLQ